MSTSTAYGEQPRTQEWHSRAPVSSPYRRPLSHPDRTPARLATSRLTDEAALPAFDVQAYLASAGLSKTIGHYERGDAIFSQGEVGTQVLYIQSGIVKLSVVSKTGREAVVAILGPGDFFGEGCLAGHRLRRGSACAMASSVILAIDQDSLVTLLQRQPAMSACLLSHMLMRNIRMEEDLLDQLFNTSEQRLARALLLLARGKGPDDAPRVVPRISQNTLADMVGTTRSRVNFFLNKFKKRGFIAYDGDRPMTVNRSLSAVLQG